MGLAGEPKQNLWKEMSCRQNLEKQRLRITELNTHIIQRTTYLSGTSRGVRSREIGRLRAVLGSPFCVLNSQSTGWHCRSMSCLAVADSGSRSRLNCLGPGLVCLRETDAVHQVLEAGVGAEGIKHGPDVRVSEVVFAALVGFFQPAEGKFFVAQFRIYDGYQPWRNVRAAPELAKGFECAGAIARKC